MSEGESEGNSAFSESDTSSLYSESSTIVYEHESFETFRHKAHDLFTILFPNEESIAVYRMAGGSFHRIVGATVTSDVAVTQREVILRIPRFLYLRLADEVAVLNYLTDHTTIPVPHVLCFDLSSENQIGSPYILQSHVPGKRLHSIYPTLPFEKKKAVIREVAQLLKQFNDITFSTIGMLVAGNPECTEVKIDQAWDYAEDIFPREDDPRPPAQSNSTRSFLEERWSFHLEEEERCGPSSRSEISYITAFRKLTEGLQLPNIDTPARIVLFHTDFAPRNIFVDEETGDITGVLDWDRAESAVVEAAWTMPAWLWDKDSTGSDLLSWVDPDEIPDDPTAQKLRTFFIQEIGNLIPSYVEVIRENKILHEILLFARLGLRSQPMIERASKFLKDKIPDFEQLQLVEL
ncbi:kinase-like domain-containing protein [Crucibulum laeve]|uniref:Kinase-like domain-containing protein n=1 Tax=Crucibulum laeve TaxID=68775 RepID=A0A5C3LRC0_9AGAR|nr:kinase-like domain-containing protein [Crucibulum laeve]